MSDFVGVATPSPDGTAGGRVSAAPFWVVADDLTGAIDSGVAFAGPGCTVAVSLDRPDPDRDRAVHVVDTDTRERGAAAYAEVAQVIARIGRADPMLKKIDSLLRGPVGPELGILRARFPDRRLIVAPAVPAVGRVTRDGRVVALDGNPIGPAVADRLAPLTVLHTDPAGLEGALRSTDTDAVVCDAESPADLDAIVHTGHDRWPPPVWVGAAGLAAALARYGGCATDAVTLPRSDRVLVIVGSHAAQALAQVDALAAHGVAWFPLDASRLVAASEAELDRLAARLSSRANRESVVVSLAGDVVEAHRPRAAEALATVCAAALRSSAMVVVTGGSTARAALTAAGIHTLRLLGEFEPGVVITAPDSRHPSHVITKSGGFGDLFTLVRLVGALTRQEGQA